MVAEAKQLGQVFRDRRKELDLSLKEVESSTSIRSNYLEAIEEGDIEKFLSVVYMYGFMRQYAVYLDLDVETLARDYPEAFKMSKVGQDVSFGFGGLEIRKGIAGNKRFSNLLWAAAFGLIFLGAYGLVKLLKIV